MLIYIKSLKERLNYFCPNLLLIRRWIFSYILKDIFQFYIIIQCFLDNYAIFASKMFVFR